MFRSEWIGTKLHGRTEVLSQPDYHAGDLVVYSMPKRSANPGPRAQGVFPAQGGDSYSYFVDKFWMVSAVLADGRLQLVTRTGKTHVISVSDPLLRPAGWWTRFRFRQRFPEADVIQRATNGTTAPVASTAVTQRAGTATD